MPDERLVMRPSAVKDFMLLVILAFYLAVGCRYARERSARARCRAAGFVDGTDAYLRCVHPVERMP